MALYKKQFSQSGSTQNVGVEVMGLKEIDGYFGFITSNLNNDGTAGKEATLFGDFRKVHIAQFGGLDILFDPYTYSGVGVPRMVITSLVDAAAVQAATFHKIIEA